VKQNVAMKDTWGHLYPEPGKYPCKIWVSDGAAGGQTVLDYECDLPNSHQTCYLVNTVLDRFEWDQAKPIVYLIECEMWFFKGCHDMYDTGELGRLTKLKQTIVWEAP